MDGRRLDPLAFELAPPVVANVGIAGGVGLDEEERPTRRERRHLAGHAPRTVFLGGGHEEQHIAGRKDPLEEVTIVVALAGARCPSARRRGPRALGVGIGAVDEDDVGHGGGVAFDDAGADLIEPQPGAVDITGHHDHRRHGRRTGDVTGRADIPSCQRVDERALAGPGASDDADDEHPRQFAAGPVEPRGDLLPFRPYAAGRRPLGERPTPPPQPRHEVVESGIVEPGRRQGGVRVVLRHRRGHIGHLENSRPQS